MHQGARKAQGYWLQKNAWDDPETNSSGTRQVYATMQKAWIVCEKKAKPTCYNSFK